MSEQFLLGLDVGGTKVEGAVFRVSDRGPGAEITRPGGGHLYIETLTTERIPTLRKEGLESVLGRMAKLCTELAQSAGIALRDFKGLGLGLPGTIHPRTQIMLAGNTGIFIGKNIGEELNRRLDNQLPQVLSNNDASCFALAEALCGAGRQYQREEGLPIEDQTGIGIILGTGVGGGVVIGGKLLKGKNGGGGEIGHTLLVHSGHPCYCGRVGCAEQYLSGPALEAQMASRLYSQIENRPKAHEIFTMAENKEPQALASLVLYRRHLVEFLVDLTTVFDPDYFVLGGGLSRQEAIYEGVEERVAQLSFTPSSAPRVYQHALSDSAGVIGAAICLLQG